MSIGPYSRVYRRMWSDGAFLGLSSPKPNAQTLFIWLITGPCSTSIPGVISAGPATIAEHLGWSPKEVLKHLDELAGKREICDGKRLGERLGEPLNKRIISYDSEARIVWIRNGIRYGAPANPNVVIGWSNPWNSIRECALKKKIYEALKAHVLGRGEGFVEAFRNSCGNGSGNGWGNHSGNGMANKEQEQEQEQEQEKEQEEESLPSEVSSSPPPPDSGEKFPRPSDVKWAKDKTLHGWLKSKKFIEESPETNRIWTNHLAFPAVKSIVDSLRSRLRQAGSRKVFVDHLGLVLDCLTEDPWWTTESKGGFRPAIKNMLVASKWEARMDVGRECTGAWRAGIDEGVVASDPAIDKLLDDALKSGTPK